MPDEPLTPPPYDSRRRVGTGFTGETTRGTDSVILPVASQPALEVIGDFEVTAKLGQGGMGAVYRARQISLDRQVALKILPTSLESDPEYVARFQREARVAASLNHGNLVKVYASGEADGCHYIAMELVEGETLGQWLRRGAMPPLEALRIILDVARALECGWRTANLIHRDIKPGNIFLSVHGAVKVGDLGIAKVAGSDTTGLTQTGRALGTPHYISPEQARGDKDLDFRADIYSLGCTLYQMLAGQTPYSGTDAMAVMSLHRDAPPPAILKIMPQCPIPIARLVSKMMKKQRRERFASYEEMIGQIETVRAQLDPSLAAPTVPQQPQRQVVMPSSSATEAPIAATTKARKKQPLAIYGGIAALAVMLGVGWVVWPKEEKLTGAQRWASDHAGDKKAGTGPGQPAAGELEPAKSNQTQASPSAGSLSSPTSTAGTPATATKDAPFINTLGMKFIPVPIVGGPTSGKRVLFSVWDTRVQDFAVFTKETGREWRVWGGDRSQQTWPAVTLSWEDAQVFCQWLTERERKADKIGRDLAYRLPSDHEWSCAVGIGDKEDPAASPANKDRKLPGIYLWGTEWPPPPGAGNFADESLKAQKDSSFPKCIEGYNDGFPYLAPVGSFSPNTFGLFDIAGNASQLCGDWMDGQQKSIVVRGAGWPIEGRDGLLASRRAGISKDHKGNATGFRVVLAPVHV